MPPCNNTTNNYTEKKRLKLIASFAKKCIQQRQEAQEYWTFIYATAPDEEMRNLIDGWKERKFISLTDELLENIAKVNNGEYD